MKTADKRLISIYGNKVYKDFLTAHTILKQSRSLQHCYVFSNTVSIANYWTCVIPFEIAPHTVHAESKFRSYRYVSVFSYIKNFVSMYDNKVYKDFRITPYYSEKKALVPKAICCFLIVIFYAVLYA